MKVNFLLPSSRIRNVRGSSILNAFITTRASDGQLRLKIPLLTVIPAKAGIQLAIDIAGGKLGPGLRRGDGTRSCATPVDRPQFERKKEFFAISTVCATPTLTLPTRGREFIRGFCWQQLSVQISLSRETVP